MVAAASRVVTGLSPSMWCGFHSLLSHSSQTTGAQHTFRLATLKSPFTVRADPDRPQKLINHNPVKGGVGDEWRPDTAAPIASTGVISVGWQAYQPKAAVRGQAGRYPVIKIDESTTKAGNYVNSAPIRTLIAAGVQRLNQEKHEQADAQKSPGCALLALTVPVGPADIGCHSERRDWLPVRHVTQLGVLPEITDNGVLIDASRYAVSVVC